MDGMLWQVVGLRLGALENSFLKGWRDLLLTLLCLLEMGLCSVLGRSLDWRGSLSSFPRLYRLSLAHNASISSMVSSISSSLSWILSFSEI